MNETQNNNNKSIKTLQTELKGKIAQMISDWISKRNLQSDDVKSLLHILCPKCKQDIDDALSQKNTVRLKEIITNSIYNEMTCFLSEECKIKRLYDENEHFNSIIIILPDGDRYYLEVKGAHIEKKNDKFMYLEIDIDEQQKKVSFQDCKKFLNISFIKDQQSKTIEIVDLVGNLQKTLTVERKEEATLDSCFDFVKTLSFCEMEIYQQNFKDGIPYMTNKMNQDSLPSKQTIIKAMQKAQKAVEGIRNNKGEEKKDKGENKTNKQEREELQNLKEGEGEESNVGPKLEGVDDGAKKKINNHGICDSLKDCCTKFCSIA